MPPSTHPSFAYEAINYNVGNHDANSAPEQHRNQPHTPPLHQQQTPAEYSTLQHRNAMYNNNQYNTQHRTGTPPTQPRCGNANEQKQTETKMQVAPTSAKVSQKAHTHTQSFHATYCHEHRVFHISIPLAGTMRDDGTVSNPSKISFTASTAEFNKLGEIIASATTPDALNALVRCGFSTSTGTNTKPAKEKPSLSATQLQQFLENNQVEKLTTAGKPQPSFALDELDIDDLIPLTTEDTQLINAPRAATKQGK